MEVPEVENEPCWRRMRVSGGDGGDDLDRLHDLEAERCERRERAEELRPGNWMVEEAQPLIGVCAREGELCQVWNVDAQGRREGQACGHAECVE